MPYMLSCFLQQVFVLCKCKCNEHCCRCDEEHHAHGAVAGTNGTVRSDSVTGHFWFCICASVHFMRTYTSYQCCLTELKRSEVWLQWHHTWASHARSSNWKFYFKFDVLNHLWGFSAENNCSTSVLPWTCMDWPQTSI